jgi:hypothetical protein
VRAGGEARIGVCRCAYVASWNAWDAMGCFWLFFFFFFIYFHLQ